MPVFSVPHIRIIEKLSSKLNIFNRIFVVEFHGKSRQSRIFVGAFCPADFNFAHKTRITPSGARVRVLFYIWQRNNVCERTGASRHDAPAGGSCQADKRTGKIGNSAIPDGNDRIHSSLKARPHQAASEDQQPRWTLSEANLSRQMHCLLNVMTFIDEWRKFSPFAKRSHP